MRLHKHRRRKCNRRREVPNKELDRRPKCLQYEEHATAIEKMIVDALPEIVGKLVSMAKEGIVAAARYLVDRMHGRPARLAAAGGGSGEGHGATVFAH